MYTCLEAMFTVDDISMLEGLMTVMMFMVFLDIFNTIRYLQAVLLFIWMERYKIKFLIVYEHLRSLKTVMGNIKHHLSETCLESILREHAASCVIMLLKLHQPVFCNLSLQTRYSLIYFIF